MARVSRRRGPTAPFELTAAMTLIPGITLTRYFDAGELLILVTSSVLNGTPATIEFVLSPFLDNQEIITSLARTFVTAGQRGAVSGAVLPRVDEGIHTIDLRAAGDAAAGDTVTTNRTELIVIQLPQWDADADIL